VQGSTPDSFSSAKATDSSILASAMRRRNSLSRSSGGAADSNNARRARICRKTVFIELICRCLVMSLRLQSLQPGGPSITVIIICLASWLPLDARNPQAAFIKKAKGNLRGRRNFGVDPDQPFTRR